MPKSNLPKGRDLSSQLSIQTHSVTTTEIHLDAEQIIKLLQNAHMPVPDNAHVEFTIPMGGDYSGMTLAFEENPSLYLNVSYTTGKTS